MGRAPCCDKANVKKGPWSPEEDAKLKAYIEKQGTGGNWIALPQKIGLKRCGKSCRLRWLNYLRPNLKHGGFSEEEDNIICSLYIKIGSRWSIIAAQLPGRTDNDIKNYWNTRLKNKLLGRQRKEQQAARRASCLKKRHQMKRESQNFILPVESLNPNVYWPVLPISTSNTNPNHEYYPCFKEQDSTKILLTKIGGRFSDDHHQQLNTTITTTTGLYPADNFSSQYQILHHNMLSSSTSTNSINSTNCSQLQSTHYDPALGMNMYQEIDYFSTELDELLYGNSPGLILNGLDHNFSGIDLVNNGTRTGTGTSISSESTSWGDVSSLHVCPPMFSNDVNYGLCQQEMLHDSTTFDESRYFG